MFPATYSNQVHVQGLRPLDDFPKTVARTLNQDFTPTSIDFHPVHQTILLGKFSMPILISV